MCVKHVSYAYWVQLHFLQHMTEVISWYPESARQAISIWFKDIKLIWG